MTDPPRRRPRRRNDRPTTDGPAMGDHPELETDDPQRVEPVDDEGRSPLVIGGIVALLVIVVIVILFLVL